MKLLAFTISLFLLQQSFSQSTTVAPNVFPNDVKVPTTVSDKFTHDYPKQSAIWSADSTTYRAQYTDSSIVHFVDYNASGSVIGYGRQVDSKVYPKAIADYMAKTYPNEPYEVWKHQDNKGTVTYYSPGVAELSWFDAKGRFIKKQKRTAIKLK